MIFRRRGGDDPEDDEDEVELVLFQGALNGKEVNLAKNARLAEAGLVRAKEIVTDALMRRAEMIRLEPKGNMALVRLFIDGVAYPGGRMSKQQALAVTQMIKLLAGLDVRERKKSQSGGVKVELQETPYELSVQSTPAKSGAEALTVRARNLKESLETPNDLGFSDRIRESIRELTQHRHGLFAVCGPTNSGTTTTMHAVVRTVDGYLYLVYSITDLSGRELVNVTPYEVKPDDDLEATVTRVVRLEADIIFMDPIRDAETAKQVFDLQKNITLMTEFSARDAAQGIVQLTGWVGDAPTVAEGLQGIVSQKLIRVLCTRCRQAFRPNPKLLAKVGLPPETKTLYRPPRPPAEDDPDFEEYEPCRDCGDIGYLGRAGLYELIEMTDPMRELVAKGPEAGEIRALARKEKMITLQQEGLRLVAEGTTSLEELQRTFKPPRRR